jgi:glycosyltransferase involved in cell wall biosynthesis
MKKMISIVTGCYNEEENVEALYKRVKDIMNEYSDYDFEHIFIDNCSKDKTVSVLKEIAKNDKRLKIIVNARNFGHIRSPFHALLQAKGDGVIYLVADFQDPPEMIRDFIKKWEEGYKIVIGVKNKSRENPLIFSLRKLFYILIKKYGETEHIDNFTGFGLYDKRVVEALKSMNDPYPYFRGMIPEIGFERYEINYTQPKRAKGRTKNNFYTLFDMAMLGFVNNSKVPLRMATFIGFGVALVSLFIALFYLVYKIINWQDFEMGLAPLVIGLFFFSSVQLFFIGIVGEYIGAIYTQVKNRPLVVEKERINFDD